MNPQWASVLVVGGVALIGAAINYGMFGRAIKDHERRLAEADVDSKLQWSHINATETSLANVRGQLGLNGK